VRGTHALQDGSLQRGGFIELLMLQHAERLTDDLTLIGVASGMNQSLNKLTEGGWKRDRHSNRL